MKKILFTLFSLVFAIVLFAQQAPPQGINYQAVIYSSTGNQQVGVNSAGQQLLNTHPVKVTFTITAGNQGPEVYKEEHDNINTDQYGLVNVIIGQGTQLSSEAFNQIDWSSGDMFLKVVIFIYPDPPVQSFTVTSYQKLWSVPYALYSDQANTADFATNSAHADSSDYADLAGNGITGVIDNGDGTLTFNYLDGSSYTTGPLTGLGGAGPQGPQGPAGQNGTNGQSSYDIWLSQGNTGTQQDFLNSLQGANGQSAYELWLAQGNIGSEGDFLNSLQGATGPQGAQGPAGNGFQNGTVLGQVMYWDGVNWIFLNPGSQAQILTICNGVPTWTTGGVCPGNGTISALNCASALNNGTLTAGTAASGVSSNVPYTGGNGGSYNGQVITSTGVTGLTATLAPGNFVTGAGSISYSISGTPNTNGTANFALNIGGQACTLSLSVAINLASQYAAGSVFCASGPTAIVDVTNPTTGKTWMDRNLGASQVATSSTDVNSYGDLYQWGRGTDGHQCRNSLYTNTLSSTDQPSHGDFILAINTPFDWRSPQNINLWQGVNGINNPCPIGYRIPTEQEMEAERLSWSSNNASGAYGSVNKFVVGGLNNGYIDMADGVGFYWTSNISSNTVTYSKRLSFGTANTNNAGMGQDGRSIGMSIRCIKN